MSFNEMVRNEDKEKPLVIGIAGGTGSGKTTITKRLLESFPKDAMVIYHDDYYKPYADMDLEERKKQNYDHPEAYDSELLLQHLADLKMGKMIASPVYDYANYTRSNQTRNLKASRILIVEGILIFHDPRICSQMDIKIFVDTDADVRILRRIKRDVCKRGRTLESVMNQYLATVKPMHELYVMPSKRKADLIVPEGGKNLVALDMLIQKIQMHLQQ